ncbi:hypothetical protein JYU34_002116 [Plutella xylostella]|uniref:Calcineurin-like phosphoesterase domain-containing protein n=1 Tax=Plutella xylostella TaxID=51655 RepID=A0ABQ7R1H3_PLUXY|nr:hypothetical protein JYU34_002116 [Plutella xylostella]
MNLRRLPTARLLLLGVAGVVVYCEWLVYRRGAREWAPLACPGDAAAAAGCTRVLLVADPQLQGELAAVFPLNWLFIWDSDRYVKATFHEALRHVQPDVVVFLGDLMDEGSIATGEQYARYVNRIFDIFAPYDHSFKPLYIPGDNDIGGENERVREDKIDLFNKIFLRPRKLIHKDIIFLEIDGITHVMPDVDDDMLSEFKLRIAVSHYGVASRQMQDKFHPHIYFSAHTHESRLVRHRGGMAHRQQRLLDKTLTVVFDNETVNEIFVPTCSYRMGTREIGYGAAVIEKDYTQMRYTVLWTPERFPSLLAYAAIALLAVLLVVIKAIIRVMASSRSYYQKLQHSV